MQSQQLPKDTHSNLSSLASDLKSQSLVILVSATWAFTVELNAANRQLTEVKNRLIFMTVPDGDTASITTANS